MSTEDKITCPVCKSTLTATYEDRVDNGVLGSGYVSQIKQKYCICLDCGVLFKSKAQLKAYRDKLLPNNAIGESVTIQLTKDHFTDNPKP
jgi:hypothetical protein